MKQQEESLYSIPARYRKMENMHIVFWLFKDISWCMIWKTLGIMMIIPTLSIAVFIAFRTRDIKSEFAHNLAVIFWISANSYWMISEFWGFDEKRILFDVEGKYLAVIPFAIGMIILGWYYFIQRPKEIHEHHVVTM